MKLELEAIDKSTEKLNLQTDSELSLADSSTYDGGFHISRANSISQINFKGSTQAANERVANSRSSLQGFTCK